MNDTIKVAAQEVFERFPLAKEVFVTPDEQCFLKEDRARLHNKDVTTVKRSDVMEAEKTVKSVKKTAEELIAFSSTCESIDELDAIIAGGEKRATVIAAISARKEVLTTKQD